MTKEQIKQNKAAYIAQKMKKEDESWRKYYTQRVLTAARLTQGELIRIDKLYLETRFCFGHGQNGISTEEEERRANEAAHAITESERWFTAENTAPAEESIKALQACQFDSCKYRIVVTVDGESHLDWVDVYGCGFANMEKAQEHYNRFGKATVRRLLDEDIPALVAAYKVQLEDIKKRCKTYWKRYGGSKLHTWSYLVD